MQNRGQTEEPPESGATAAFRETKARSGSVVLHVRIAGGSPGAADVLIAVGGGPGLSSRYMIDLEQLAGPAFTVVTYDPRGTGRSTSPPPEKSSYGLPEHVRDLDAVREEAGGGHVHVLGHSWGGLVAMMYAATHPDKVNSIVLVNSVPPTWLALMEGKLRVETRIEKLQKEGVLPEALPNESAELRRTLLRAYFSNPDFRFFQKGGEDLEWNSIANRLTNSAVEGYDITAEIGKLSHRVLIVYGDSDPFGLPMVEAVRNALVKARAESVRLEKCGHFWQENPEKFFSALRSFLKIHGTL